MAMGRQNGDAGTTELVVTVIVAGPTAWDEQERLGGRADMPLSGLGFEIARRHANQLPKGRSLGCVVSGTDEASREVARLLAERTTEPARVRVEPDLAEMDVGLWEGMRRGELLGRCPKVCRGWEADGNAFTPPEGESFAEVSDRIGRVMERLVGRSKGDGLTVVVRPIVAGIVKHWLAVERGEPASTTGCGGGTDLFEAIHCTKIPWTGSRRGVVGEMVGGMMGSIGGMVGGVMGFTGSSGMHGGSHGRTRGEMGGGK